MSLCHSFKGLRLFAGVCLLGSLLVGGGGQTHPAFAQSASAAAASEIRFQQMEKEIRRLTGQIEEQSYDVRQMRGEIRALRAELDALRGTGEKASSGDYADQFSKSSASSAQTGTYAPPQAVAPSLGTLNKPAGTGAVVSNDDAPRQYDYAYSYIKARDFDRAEGAFAQFIKDYPSHPLVSNAKYWYGETFYVRGSYERAARVFAEGYQQYPESSKVSSNLLKLGMSLIGMGKTDDACIALKQLKKDYSKSSVPVMKRAETEMQKINCI